MHTTKNSNLSVSPLKYLPSYANYLVQNKLTEYAGHQLKLSLELNLPILKAFSNLSYEQVLSIVIESSRDYLFYLSQNKAEEQIDISLTRWQKNQLPLIDQKDIVAEDITLITYIRKRTFLHFINEYTSNPQELVALITEIDLFLIKGETEYANTYINLLQGRIEESKEELRKSENLYKQAQALSHIGHFSLNLKTRTLYLTDELKRIYNLDPLRKDFEYDDIIHLRHPDDKDLVDSTIENTIQTNEPFDFEFRIITKEEIEKKVHAIGEVKFDEKGFAEQLVGTIQDVSEQNEVREKLEKRNRQHKQAEALTHIGSYAWNLQNDEIEWSDEMYRIYGLDAINKKKITGKEIVRFTHPDDLDKVNEEVSESISKNKPHDFYYKLVLDDGTLKILHVRGEVTYHNGQPAYFIGTAQDETEKQLLISKLQESEKLHKQAQALAQLGNWTLDLKTNLYTWSEEMYRIYETEIGENFNLEKWASYIHPDEREGVLAYFYNCIKNKQLYDRQHRVILANGKIKTLRRKGELVLDEKGEPIKLIGTTQDVTQQFRIEQELKENQNFIQKIADATPSIIASYNVNTGQYTFISHGIKKLLGYEAEDAKKEGVNFFVGIIHPDDLPLLMETNKQAVIKANLPENKDKDEVMEFIYRMRHIEGHYLWFHTYGTIFDRNASGQIEHVLNISLDITEQHEAIKKIKEQEHFIKHIADASPTVLYVFDIETKSIVYINREIFFVLGYTREEILNMGGGVTGQLYHPDDVELLPERNQSTKKIAEPDIMHQYECRMKNKEGEWQWFLVREVVFKTDDEGRVLQIVGAALDITRRKDMEKILLQNSFLLEQSNASLEEFAYVASHDLKEPLRKISTFGDRLADSQVDNLTPEGKLYLRKIVDASQRMQLMISDLLSISMISGNKGFEPESLEQIYKETLQTLEYKIEQKNAIITSDNLPVANIVPSQFRQLFQNLISNSLKFVHDDVQPVITIKHAYIKQEQVAHYQLATFDKHIKIEFTDNGIGFENEYAGKIFAIFQRLHGRSEYEGSGIGLAICKKIVEHHGGVIYATGVPDKGATFTIILPA